MGNKILTALATEALDRYVEAEIDYYKWATEDCGKVTDGAKQIERRDRFRKAVLEAMGAGDG